jgi:predicted nucleotidyltransferase
MIRNIADSTTALQLSKLLGQLKTRLQQHYSDRLCGVYLFGSYSREEADAESDVDVLIVLDDFSQYGAEVDSTAQIVGDLSLEHTVSINIVFVRQADWQKNDTPFLKNVREEAVAV